MPVSVPVGISTAKFVAATIFVSFSFAHRAHVSCIGAVRKAVLLYVRLRDVNVDIASPYFNTALSSRLNRLASLSNDWSVCSRQSNCDLQSAFLESARLSSCRVNLTITFAS